MPRILVLSHDQSWHMVSIPSFEDRVYPILPEDQTIRTLTQTTICSQYFTQDDFEYRFYYNESGSDQVNPYGKILLGKDVFGNLAICRYHQGNLVHITYDDFKNLLSKQSVRKSTRSSCKIM